MIHVGSPPPDPPVEPHQFPKTRLSQLLYLLLVVGHVDGALHGLKRAAIAHYLEAASASLEPSARQAWRDHLDELCARLEYELATARGDGSPRDGRDHLTPRLIARALELFAGFTGPEQAAALAMLRTTIHADGVVAPPELRLHDELVAYLNAPRADAARPAPAPAPLVVAPAEWNPLKSIAHPLLDPLEQTYSPHPQELAAQLERDYLLIGQAIARWHDLRATGHARLHGVTDVAQLPVGARFLDGHVHVMRPDRPVELVVLGDLHGCYGCLKAALLQSDFIRRVWAHQWDPQTYPDVKLVLLGDYIDRGRFSFDGVLRAVLQLLVAMPDHVIVLRGNHEHFLDDGAGVRSLVYPAEALPSIAPYVPPPMLEAYRLLFEAMPTAFVFDRTLFVHGGIPREDTFAERYQDLSSLGDPVLRFQMMWSDPSPAEHVPVGLQRRNARFPFGRDQFRAFMARTGLRALVRGHEQVERGFEVTYDLGDLMLLNLFSAGGADNRDLPEGASYRRVTPMALTVRVHAPGTTPVVTPWPIDYQPFNYDTCNGLHRAAPLLPVRHE